MIYKYTYFKLFSIILILINLNIYIFIYNINGIRDAFDLIRISLLLCEIILFVRYLTQSLFP